MADPSGTAKLIGSTDTRKYVGQPFGDFMAEKSGADYLLLLSERDYKQNIKIDPNATPWQKMRAQAEYGRQHIEKILPNDLRAEISQLPKFEQQALYWYLSNPEIQRQQQGNGASPATATAFMLPSGKKLGSIALDTEVLDLTGHRFDLDPTGQRLPTPATKDAEYTDNGAIAMLHELGHIRDQTSGNSKLPTLKEAAIISTNPKSRAELAANRHAEELYADRDGHKLYAEAHAKGLTRDPHTGPQALNNIRIPVALAQPKTYGSDHEADTIADHNVAPQIALSGNNANPMAGKDPKHDRTYMDFLAKIDAALGQTYLDADRAIASKESIRAENNVAEASKPFFKPDVLNTKGHTQQEILKSCAGTSLAANLDNEIGQSPTKLTNTFGACVRQSLDHDLIAPVLDRIIQAGPGTPDQILGEMVRPGLRKAEPVTAPAPVPPS